MICSKPLSRSLFATALMLSLTACAPSSYTVKEPAPSGIRYQAPNLGSTTISQTDNRTGDEKVFSSGILPATLKIGSKEIDPPAFLATHVSAELNSRGFPVKVTTTGTDLPHTTLHTFRVKNHRASGFGPFVTLTFISADIDTGIARKRIGVFVKRGKVPVWSFDEVVEPTLSQPLSIAVKEYASKLANTLYGYKASDSDVAALITKVSGQLGENGFLDVYALGFTNNPKAIDTLVGLTKHADEYVRLAAISSLGNLGATSQFSLLKSIYTNRDSQWQDRAMAIKSIGDLGTAEAKAFLEAEMKRWDADKSTNEAKWTAEIIGLYL
jgi:hypothetical protein